MRRGFGYNEHKWEISREVPITTFLIEKGVYMEEEQQQAKLAIVIIQ